MGRVLIKYLFSQPLVSDERSGNRRESMSPDAIFLLSSTLAPVPQIDFKKDLVVDLGASPGGWSLVARKFLDVGQGGQICAVDLLEMEPVDGCDFFIGDFRRKDVKDRLISACNGRQPDIILSDMLHNTTGVHSVDHHRSIDLCFEVLDFSKQMLRWIVPAFA